MRFRFLGVEVNFGISVLILLFLLWTWAATIKGTGLVHIIAVIGAVVLMFGGIFVHEFGHVLMARRFGIACQGLRFWMFGGIASMESAGKTAKQEFAMVAAGPLTNVLQAALFFGLILIAPNHGILASFLGTIIFFNIVMALFNLLPVYPLDGGRLLHSIVWMLRKDEAKAQQVAVKIGMLLLLLLLGAAFVAALMDKISWGNALWFLMIGALLFFMQRKSQSN